MASQQPDTLDFADRSVPANPDPGTLRAYANVNDGLFYVINEFGVNVLAGSLSVTPPIIGYVINNGNFGTDIGPLLIAPRSGNISKCKVVVKASDTVADLTFRIKKNGVNVFSVNPTIAHNTPNGTLLNFTGLTSIPFPIAADDIFQMDILSGTPTWTFTAQLE